MASNLAQVDYEEWLGIANSLVSGEYPARGSYEMKLARCVVLLEEQHAILFAALTAIQQAAGVEHDAETFESFAHATATAALNGVRCG